MASGGSLESVELHGQLQRPSVLPIGWRLDIHALDRTVGRVHDTRELRPGAGSPRLAHVRRPPDKPVALIEQRAHGLVRFDPRRRRARVLEHPVGQRPFTGGRVVAQRQPFALIRQAVERAFLHGLADLTLDERLAGGLPG